MAKANKPIILAAGGTGGHIFPAEALARELLKRGHTVTLVTDGRGHAFGDSLPEVPVHRIRAGSPSGGLLGKLKGGVQLLLGVFDARTLLKQLDPIAVVGFGGYPSVPTVYAAGRAGVPVLLHEQNAVLGRANRLLFASARRVAVAYPAVSGIADPSKLVQTGNPVRPAVAAKRHAFYDVPAANGPVRLLVMGGSQGARVFSEVVPAALALLPADLRGRIHLAQQCRPEDLEGARAALAPLSLGSVELESFFRDVPERLASAHLAITRAGASTVAELTCIGRPAVLVPYPFATDDHQTANARAVASAGAAWHVPQPQFTAETLAQRLTALLSNPAELARAAQASAAWGTDEAASKLADAVLALAGRSGNNGNHANATEAAE
ncbi:undecaprenyldiphospho-muramoylpentapeptide beta-N-acetylglucosaminyltransferase [Azospirillum sp. TSO22-1]|uniref:undecaprenyldiphospho-muramoylpentapeptide beta-N-acetylglucosaminyltransferase n=1 Tax=Azospirillum sp. TSO22-1 TaxID=716789 RepID=UPI000D61C374|nr:undecaprenyldiphospho-muramoylpentapeptide beta-N-acetylglucosaminyltransferase [Azospirillum sp. TSO22-1]PWC54283.1 UDP-diphospho-muramoylpentapeptide beta-N-acetylglucosaminyltransferase [Azospirillum sp. TSO22-1]